MGGDRKQLRLGDVARVKHGFAFDGAFFVEEPTQDLLVTPGNFEIGGGFKLDKRKYYRGPVPEDYVLFEGELIVTMTDLSKTSDTLGYSALVPASRSLRFLHNQRIGKVEVTRPDLIDKHFLYWLLRTAEYRAEVLAGATGTTVKHTAPCRIEAFQFHAPSLTIQRAIARILGSLDDKIELNREMNETLEAMARALYKSWFVDFDPVRAKMEGRQPVGMDAETEALFPHRFEASKLGEVPKGWRRAPLGEWAIALSGGTPSKANAALWGGDIPWISPKSMTEIHADQAESFVTPAAIGNGTRTAPAGATLVMVRGMGLHERVRVSQARGEVTFNQDVKALVPRTIDPTLLLFSLLDGQAELLTHVQSAGHGTGVLPTDVLLGHVLAMPELPAQQALAVTFDSTNRRIEAARKEARTLAHLRDALLPMLMSGELRPSTEPA